MIIINKEAWVFAVTQQAKPRRNQGTKPGEQEQTTDDVFEEQSRTVGSLRGVENRSLGLPYGNQQ